MVPSESHSRWRDLVTESVAFQPSFLALKLLLKRAHLRYQADSSETTVQALAGELHTFFAKYERFLGDDIAFLFSKEEIAECQRS